MPQRLANMTYKIPVIALLVIYMTAMIGFVTPTQQAWYLSYVPLFLGFNGLTLLAYAEEKTKKHWGYILGTIVGAWLIELGANTMGLVTNGKSFGLGLEGVPFIKGLFWWILVFSSAYLASKLPANNIIKTISSTVLTIVLFSIIHQSANSLDFWTINKDQPALDFILPTIIGILFSFLYFQFKIATQNKIAIYVYGGLFVFFVSMIMFLK